MSRQIDQNFTKPEIALLEKLAPDSDLGFLMNYRTHHYDLVIYPVHASRYVRTKGEQAAFSRLLKRGALIYTKHGECVINPTWHELIFGNTFAYTFTRALAMERREVTRQRDELRAKIEAAINNDVSEWSLQFVWDTYQNYDRSNLPSYCDPAMVARWDRLMSGGKRALYFHHYATDAYQNAERELQSLDQWDSLVATYGVHRLAERALGNTATP